MKTARTVIADRGSKAARTPGARRRATVGGALLLSALSGCGSGGPSEPAAQEPQITTFAAVAAEHFVGEPAELLAVFSGGTGRIDPGGIIVTSGRPVRTPGLAASATFRLAVAGSSATVTRDLPINVRYRDRLRTLSMPFSRRGHVSVELQDGRVLVIGGADESGGVTPTTNFAFDPESETFAEFGALIDPRFFHVAVVLDNGYVLVVGGDIPRADTREAELIDGRTGAAFTTGTPMRNRLIATATLLDDGRVLLVGGRAAEAVEGGFTQVADATAELYDPATGQFTPTAGTLSYARFGHSANLLPDGRVLIYGGLSDGFAPLPPEIYDSETQRFTTVQLPEPNARINHVALGLQDRRVGIFSGEDFFLAPLATNFRFDMANGVFEPLVDLACPRTRAQGVLLTDGRVLLAGGHTVVPCTANTEIIAPAAASSAAGPQMSTDRVLHTVNRLRNGKVLIVGGVDGGQGPPLMTAEIFE